MKITFIICEVIIILLFFFVTTFGIRLSGENAWISGKILLLGSLLLATAFLYLKHVVQEKKRVILALFTITITILIATFTVPKIFLNLRNEKQKVTYKQTIKKLSIILNKELPIYNDGKIIGIRFELSVSLPKRLKKDPYKLVPILEIPFLADKKDNIYLSLMKIRSCGILQPQAIPCNIINKKSDHYSNINWPSLTKNENIYINLGPANGESISWLKRNHKGHYIPPSKYFDGTLRRLPMQISLQLGKKRPVILNLKTENKYNLYDIYLNNGVDVF